MASIVCPVQGGAAVEVQKSNPLWGLRGVILFGLFSGSRMRV
mgnify:FL=1|jgi:hypothetical protein